MGSLADSPPEDGHSMSGVLIRKGFTHNILAPQDLYEYSGTSLLNFLRIFLTMITTLVSFWTRVPNCTTY